MAEEFCPECGCQIGIAAYEKNGVLYCCEPCAIHGKCKCACCTEIEEQ